MTVTGLSSTPVYTTTLRHQAALSEVASGKRSVTFNSPATLQIGQRLLYAAQSTSAANHNVTNAISRVQTTDAFAQQSTDIVSRIRELSVQASNGVLTDHDRAALQSEVSELTAQLNLNHRHTTFNGKTIIQGDDVSVAVANDGTSATVSSLDIDPGVMNLDAIDIRTVDGAQAAIETVDTALDVIADQRNTLGVQQRTLEQRQSANLEAEGNTRHAGSRMSDADIAESLMRASTAGIQAHIGLAVHVQGAALNGRLLTNLL